MCKSKGGLKLHNGKKHPELNNCAEPDYTRMATENFSPSQLEDMVKEIFDNLSKDECYSAEMRRKLKTAKVHITNCDELYKEGVECLPFMLKKNDAEKFYEKYYSSLPLKAKSLFHACLPAKYSTIVVKLRLDS